MFNANALYIGFMSSYRVGLHCYQRYQYKHKRNSSRVIEKQIQYQLTKT